MWKFAGGSVLSAVLIFCFALPWAKSCATWAATDPGGTYEKPAYSWVVRVKRKDYVNHSLEKKHFWVAFPFLIFIALNVSLGVVGVIAALSGALEGEKDQRKKVTYSSGYQSGHSDSGYVGGHSEKIERSPGPSLPGRVQIFREDNIGWGDHLVVQDAESGKNCDIASFGPTRHQTFGPDYQEAKDSWGEVVGRVETRSGGLFGSDYRVIVDSGGKETRIE